jgi:uncharacterized membrane protein
MAPPVVPLFAAMGVLLVALAIPLFRRRIKPNLWYGLRVPATLADEGVWYDANAASGRDMILLGILQVALAVLLPLFDVSEIVYVIVNVTVITIGAMWITISGWRRANRLRRVSRVTSGDARGSRR